MDIVILFVAMIVVGAIIGFLAGPIFKGERPKGEQTDYIAAIVTTVVVGLMDWYVIPALGFSPTMRLIGVILEPPLAALLVLWLIRRANS
jgi:uncharacterized membrane protein YeaQ/YmgE (transglycosylase-associated protein family)